MSQYKDGSVAVTNGSATVTGTSTLFSANIAVGDSFKILGENATYSITSVGSNTSITISPVYAGTSGSGKAYVISKDFTPNHNMYEPNGGDVDWPFLLTQALRRIDSYLPLFSASQTPGASQIPVTDANKTLTLLTGAAPFTALKVGYTGEARGVYLGQASNSLGFIGSGYYYNSSFWQTKHTVACNIQFLDTGIGFYTNTGLTADTNYTPSQRMLITGSGFVLVGLSNPNASGAVLQTKDGITFPATQVASSDPNTLDDYREASFTATATGMTTSPTATVEFVRVGKEVTMTIPSITGTSNATSFTLTGGPTTMRPITNRYAPCRVFDNGGATGWGMVQIGTDGTITVFLSANALLGPLFTTSGTKGIYASTFTYMI